VSDPAAESRRKLARLRAAIAAAGLDGVVLTSRGSFAWITAGGDGHVVAETERAFAAVAVSHDRAWVLGNRIELPRLRAEEPLGDLVPHEFPWTRALRDGLRELLPPGRWAGEDPLETGLQPLPDRFLLSLRPILEPEEVERLRVLGADASAVLERIASALQPGDTERAVAAALSAEVLRRGMNPTVALVGFDHRLAFRHPVAKDTPLREAGLLVLCAERHGMVVSLSRMVCIGDLDPERRARHLAACQVEAALWEATRPGVSWGDALQAGIAAYAREGHADEWQNHHQGGPTGYAPRELVVTPGETLPIAARQGVAWNPSVGGTKSEDTFLLLDGGREVLTAASAGWPTVAVRTPGGELLRRPAILPR
jgi:Xaa-Pro aminopeptidase